MRSQIHWRAPVAEFGGLSGIEVVDGGTRILVVSDTGTLFEADAFRRDGVLTDLRVSSRVPLRTTQGEIPAPFYENAEGLAIGTAPGFYVAYEAWARIWYYAAADQLPVWTHAWDRFWHQIGNEGFEALAVDASGALFAISEHRRTPGSWFPVYRRDQEIWQEAFSIQPRDGFLPSGADFGPDGALYLLERRYRWYEGFSTRIRRIHLGPDGVVSEDLLLDSPPGLLDNSEGISVWSDPGNVVHITLVSDDNFNPFQRTLVTEFILTD